ncbi:MAG: NAD(P)-dependent oxidoreductase [Dysgonamonadaceae bacterium]|jgi:nucleoside-diphosphate-sugar epimerase|nr:NAD(P)-dependent oxidoreductase [Dysgonamonadaceae bacterium]
MIKILITGASGFIGSFLTNAALEREWQVWAGIRRSSSREYLSDARLRFIDLNYADPVQLRQQISEHATSCGKWDYIIHNAGVTKCLHADDFDKINHVYTRNFIEALKDTGTVPTKFILMSSLSASPDAPTAYGRSKYLAERFLLLQTDFRFVIFRPTGVYGPRERDYFLMIKSIRSGINGIAGFKPQRLTFIYVKDLVKAVFMALQSDVSSRIYNITDGFEYSDREFTEIVKTILGKKRVLNVRVPLALLQVAAMMTEGISKLSGRQSVFNRDKFKIIKQRDWTCDTLPIQQDLDFHADYPLESGLRETIDWYRENHWL